MRTFAWFGLGLMALAADARAEQLSACIWNNIASADKGAISDAYHRASVAGVDMDMSGLNAVLDQSSETLRQALVQCRPGQDTQAKIADGLVRLTAVEESAAADITSAPLVFRPPLTRKQLDDAWRQAPEVARQCFRAGYAKTLSDKGLKVSSLPTDATCADTKAPNWFIRHFKLRGREIVVARQLIMFIAAKAGLEHYEEVANRPAT